MTRLWAATIAAGAALAVAWLPVPPLTDPGRLWSWWIQVGPLVGLFAGTRIVLLATWAAWAALVLVATLARSGRWAAGTSRLLARWGRKRGLGALIRLLLGVSSSAGVLAACSSPRSSSTVPPAPILIAPAGVTPVAAPPTAAARPTSDAGHSGSSGRRPAPTRQTSSGRRAAPISEGTAAPREAPTPARAGQPAGPATATVTATSPAPATAGSATSSEGVATWTVRPGDDLWSIAATVMSTHGGGSVAGYWVQLIEANRSYLPDPADPSLLFPGDLIVLPPPASPGT